MESTLCNMDINRLEIYNGLQKDMFRLDKGEKTEIPRIILHHLHLEGRHSRMIN